MSSFLSDLPPEQLEDAVRQAVQSRIDAPNAKPPVVLDESPARAEIAAAAVKIPLLPIRPSYTIADFLHFQDEAFVVNAHVGILQRKPAPKEISRWMTVLNQGTPRLEILRRIRFSPEGQGRNVRVLGLSSPDAAAKLMHRQQIIAQQLKTVWSKKVKLLRREVRSLRQRVMELERAVMPVATPTNAKEKMDRLIRAWEARLSSKGERLTRKMDDLQDRVDRMTNEDEALLARRSAGE